MYVLHRSCAFTNRRGHTLHRPKTNVSHGKYSWHAGFIAHWLSCQRPFAQIDVVPRHDEIFRTTLHRWTQPVRVRCGANQHEKHRCWNSFNRANGLGLDIETSNLTWYIREVPERIPMGFLVIACDSGGNLFCISLAGEDAGQVSYLDLT